MDLDGSGCRGGHRGRRRGQGSRAPGADAGQAGAQGPGRSRPCAPFQVTSWHRATGHRPDHRDRSRAGLAPGPGPRGAGSPVVRMAATQPTGVRPQGPGLTSGCRPVLVRSGLPGTRTGEAEMPDDPGAPPPSPRSRVTLPVGATHRRLPAPEPPGPAERVRRSRVRAPRGPSPRDRGHGSCREEPGRELQEPGTVTGRPARELPGNQAGNQAQEPAPKGWRPWPRWRAAGIPCGPGVRPWSSGRRTTTSRYPPWTWRPQARLGHPGS